MSKDVQCPYCEKWQDICHDDGYGYEEDQTHEQECSDCCMTFAFTTSISFYYEANKAPCLNDGEHEWKKMHVAPPWWLDAKYCKNCGHKEWGKMVKEEL